VKIEKKLLRESILKNASYSKRVLSPTELSWHYANGFFFHHTFHDFHYKKIE
jgi:hypothetical protein